MIVARVLLEERASLAKSHALYMAANKRDPCNYPLTESKVPYVPDYIMIGDELTKDADSQSGVVVDAGFSVTTETFVELMKLAPPKTVLMSATLPRFHQLPEFYQSITEKHPNMVIKSFYPSEAKVGCALISQQGRLFAPHIGCQTREDVQCVMSIIKSNPFIGRFYTFRVLLEMSSHFEQLSISVPDFALLFDDPTKANQPNIQSIAYNMLGSLLDKPDALIQQACQWSDEMDKRIAKEYQLDMAKILTTDIGRFNKGCLVFSSDPIATAISVYKANFSNYGSSDSGSVSSHSDIFQRVQLGRILEKYWKDIEECKRNTQDAEEKSEKGETKNSWKKKAEKIKFDAIHNLASKKCPVWKFPPELQLCSEAHIKMFGSDKYAQRSSSAGASVYPEQLPELSKVSTEILTMLASGVGIYTKKSKHIDDEYLQAVLHLAKVGAIRIIFTDSSIAYGTNMAVSDIIVVDEPVISTKGETCDSIDDIHSMNTIFQMLGRAGRGGNLSSEARIYTTSSSDNLIQKIGLFIKGQLYEGNRDEVANINRAYSVLW